eukprot:COSAG04_NODE_109_length_25931_cov_38.787279_4_plen_377_part_00
MVRAVRAASRMSRLAKINQQTKRVMTGAPRSRHIPGMEHDEDGLLLSSVTRAERQAATAHATLGPFSPGRGLPHRLHSRPAASQPVLRHSLRWAEHGGGSPMSSFSSAISDTSQDSRRFSSDGARRPLESTRSLASTYSFRHEDGRASPSGEVEDKPSPRSPSFGETRSDSIGTIERSASVPSLALSDSLRRGDSLGGELPRSRSQAAQQLDLLRMVSSPSPAFDDDGYAVESPKAEGMLDWVEVGQFFDSHAVRKPLSSAMLRADTPVSPARPLSRAAAVAKEQDRFATTANRAATPTEMRRASAFQASPILARADVERERDMALPWRSLVRSPSPNRFAPTGPGQSRGSRAPSNLDGRSTSISSTGVVAGISVN